MQTKVLLVDDHALLRKGLYLLLDGEPDLQVVGEAENGEMALQLAEELGPDVIVMDISMPGLNGIEATRQILAAHPGTRILALSIHGEKNFVDDMLAAGAAGYILKESVPEELITGIRTVKNGEVYLSAAITEVVVSEYRSLLTGPQTADDPGMKKGTGPLLKTKHYPPSISADLVPRPRLLARLDRHLQRPVTLISAPAGYGKSVLASTWLQASDHPSAWVSLDEDDNDLLTFLSYLLAAIQNLFPSIRLGTKTLLNAAVLPANAVLARYLLNDLDQIQEKFIVVLDDLHRIHQSAVYDLLAELLQHPSPSLHLIMISRQDPPLPIAKLRAKQRVTEIRQQDLRFTTPETSLLLEILLRREIKENTAAEWVSKMEGWVTGLRLAALSLRHRDLGDDLTIVPQGDSQYLQEYLLAEVLSHLPPHKQDGLLKLSILDRFCAPLCEALCQRVPEDPGSFTNGSDFLTWLQDANLFLIPLDGRGEWFRFHHLFQQLLQEWLEQQTSPDEVAAIHTQASAWFAETGLIYEALEHALAAGDIPNAVHLVEQHRNHLMNTEQWHRLDSWLQKLPPETIEKNPKLLITQAWSGMMFHSQYNQWVNTPDQAADLLAEASMNAEEKMMVEAEINALRTTLLYSTGEVNRSIDLAEQVLENLHPESNSMRGQTASILAMAQQGMGTFDQARKTIQTTIDNYSSSNPIMNTKMLIGLCAVYWLEGNIPEIKQPALQLLKIGKEYDLPESISFGRYFLGCYHYLRNEIVEAETHFRVVVENRYLAREHYHAQCVFGLALCEIAQGRSEQARQVVESLLGYIMETGNTWLYEIAQAFQAELALQLNQNVEPYIWKKVVDPNFLAPMYVFYIPKLTAAKAMLEINTPQSQKDAADLLDHLNDIVVLTHNRRVRIDVLALQALLHDALDEDTVALEKLTASLALAKLGGFIRNYVDLGPKMASLLSRLQTQSVDGQDLSRPYIARILAAFPEADRATQGIEPLSIGLTQKLPQSGLVEPLTKRELQILRLLGSQLSVDDIATELVISSGTVRTHTKNLYSKLDVHSRFEAVQRGKDLNLL